MLSRQTSRDAYDEIQRTGVINEKQRLVYNWLYRNGPATAGEVTLALKKPHEVHPSYHRRLDELSERGVADRIGERECKVTGRNVTLWDVTDNLPRLGPAKKVIRRPTGAQFRRAVTELRRIYKIHEDTAMEFSEDLQYVCKWLAKESKK